MLRFITATLSSFSDENRERRLFASVQDLRGVLDDYGMVSDEERWPRFDSDKAYYSACCVCDKAACGLF